MNSHHEEEICYIETKLDIFLPYSLFFMSMFMLMFMFMFMFMFLKKYIPVTPPPIVKKYRVTPDGCVHKGPRRIIIKVVTFVRQGFSSGTGDKWINPYMISCNQEEINPDIGKTTLHALMKNYVFPGKCIEIKKTHEGDGSIRAQTVWDCTDTLEWIENPRFDLLVHNGDTFEIRIPRSDIYNLCWNIKFWINFITIFQETIFKLIILTKDKIVSKCKRFGIAASHTNEFSSIV